MLLISLDWAKPADGVEVVPALDAAPHLAEAIADIPLDFEKLDPVEAAWFSLEDDAVIRGKSDRLTPYKISVSNLEDPYAVRFVNARTKDDLAAFIRRFGEPQRSGPTDKAEGEFVKDLAFLRADLTQGLELTNAADDDAARSEWASEHLAFTTLRPVFECNEVDQRPRLAFRPETLSDLMFLEVAFALDAGAKLRRCEHCGTAFLIGHLTGRRSTAVYCSDRCRVAALRAKNSKSK